MLWWHYILRFESGVISYGSQADVYDFASAGKFENGVIPKTKM